MGEGLFLVLVSTKDEPLTFEVCVRVAQELTSSAHRGRAQRGERSKAARRPCVTAMRAQASKGTSRKILPRRRIPPIGVEINPPIVSKGDGRA